MAVANMASKSKVWLYFDFLSTNGKMDKTTTVCKICNTHLKYATGSTSSMTKHLLRRHGTETNKNDISVSSNVESKPETESRSASSTCSTRTLTSTGQLRLQESFSLTKKLNRTSTKYASITRAIGIFIAKDMRPFSVVENPGFVNMVRELEPRYEIPCRTHFSEKVIPKLYEDTKSTVSEGLKQASFIALTTDSWTSRATQSYNTVTAHFIHDWKINSFVLQTRAMDESHTAEHLSDFLTTVVAEWDLRRNGQLPSLVTDNARNIINAGKLAGLQPHIGCFVHVINLATQKGLKVSQMDRLLGRIRRIVTFFHKSSTAMAVLKSKQTLLELPNHKLIGDVSTRWNSSFDMLNRFSEQRIAIEATLMSKDVKKNTRDIIYTLSDDDIESVEKILQVLKPMKTVTALLCGEKSPTVSLIHPLKEMLMHQLQLSVDDDTQLVSAVKSAILEDIIPRYMDPEIQLFLWESSCLDPRFKAMPYITEDDRQDVYTSLVQKIQHLQNAVKVKEEKSDDGDPMVNSLHALPSMPSLQGERPAENNLDGTFREDNSVSCSVVDKDLDEPPTKKSALDDLFGDVFVTRVEPAKPLELRIKDELGFYRSAESIPLSADPLEWWQKHEPKLPLLGKLALKYLCIPATSVASERVFSTAGDLVSAQRACLKSDQTGFF